MTCAPGLLERARPLDVALLVEARGQLDQHGHLLVALGGALQAGDDRRAAAGAIERLLDREHVGIVGRLREQRDHRIVGVVRVVQQHVALVEHREQVGLLVAGEHVDRLQRRIAQRVEAGSSVSPISTRRSSGPGTA